MFKLHTILSPFFLDNFCTFVWATKSKYAIRLINARLRTLIKNKYGSLKFYLLFAPEIPHDIALTHGGYCE